MDATLGRIETIKSGERLARIPLFWILQTVGWGGYALDRYLSENNFFPTYFIYLVVACGLTFALRPFYRWVWRKRPSVFVIGLIVVFSSVVAAYIWLIVGQVIFVLVGIMKSLPAPLPVFLADTFKYSLQHHKPFLFLSWSVLYFGIKYYQDMVRQRSLASEAKALTQEAELKMLRYQLNPHFLFNSLNSIQALIREEPKRAAEMLGQLSEFLRYSLKEHSLNVRLEDEIESIQSYLEIEKIRFEDKLEVEFDIDQTTKNFEVPCFLLHPLIENAIKYGMETSELPLKIILRAKGDDEKLYIEIANTGRWLSDNEKRTSPLHRGTGIGLENVRKRLEQAFHKHSFTHFERDGWVRVVIEVEKKRGL